jgi:hypothetical protein
MAGVSPVGAKKRLGDRERDQCHDDQLQQEKDTGRRPAEMAARRGRVLDQTPYHHARDIHLASPAHVEDQHDDCQRPQREPAGRQQTHSVGSLIIASK